MLNRVLLQGRLVADPELNHTQSGIKVARMRLAVDRDFKTKEGSREADFIAIVAWRATAEFVGKWFKKGSPVVVDGKLQSRSYDDRDGNRRTAVEVIADNVYFAGQSPQGKKEQDTFEGTNSDAGLMNPDPYAEMTEYGGDLPF